MPKLGQLIFVFTMLVYGFTSAANAADARFIVVDQTSRPRRLLSVDLKTGTKTPINVQFEEDEFLILDLSSDQKRALIVVFEKQFRIVELDIQTLKHKSLHQFPAKSIRRVQGWYSKSNITLLTLSHDRKNTAVLTIEPGKKSVATVVQTPLSWNTRLPSQLTPDGKQLIFHSSVNRKNQVHIVDIVAKKVHSLPTDVSFLTCSPGGEKWAWRRNIGGKQICEIGRYEAGKLKTTTQLQKSYWILKWLTEDLVIAADGKVRAPSASLLSLKTKTLVEFADSLKSGEAKYECIDYSTSSKRIVWHELKRNGKTGPTRAYFAAKIEGLKISEKREVAVFPGSDVFHPFLVD